MASPIVDLAVDQPAMRWSEQSLRWQLASVAMLIAVIGTWALLVHWVFDLLPREIAAIVGACFMFFLLGGWVGNKAARQHYLYGNPEWPLVRIREPHDPVERTRLKRAWGRYLVGYIAFLTVLFTVVLLTSS